MSIQHTQTLNTLRRQFLHLVYLFSKESHLFEWIGFSEAEAYLVYDHSYEFPIEFASLGDLLYDVLFV